MGPAGDATAAYFQQIDDLTQLINNDQIAKDLKEITRQHWKPSDTRLACYNRTCRKQFSLIDRPHHCRKCGEVFCAKCVSFQRRLNRLANFDPDGELHKVCQTCFEKDKFVEGQTRSYTHDFKVMRKVIKERGVPELNSANLTVWRSKFNFDRECQRLIQGFEKSVGNSEVKRTLHEMRSVLSTPDWMKSSVWMLENMANTCQLCGEKISWLTSKLWCRVCGTVICSNCSSKDLLIYIPDEERGYLNAKARLVVIYVVGSPSVEPEVSLHLRVCNNCREKLSLQQAVQFSEEEDVEEQRDGDFLGELARLHERFRSNEERVRSQLPKYREVAASLVDNSRTTSAQSNMKTLAKSQEDLADVLSQHITIVQKLKQLRPRTPSQSLLLRTYVKAKCAFYLENMSVFRSTKHELSELVPAESLDFIQRVMDKNAIISTHLYLRQLVYEIIHLCSRHQLDDTIATFLMEVEAQVEADVCKCLLAEREDVDEHMDIVKEMIKSRMKSNRLIRTSRKSGRVEKAMLFRAEIVLRQVSLQLQLASAHRSFGGSKRSLEAALARIKDRDGEKSRSSAEKEEDGFVLVDKTH